MNNNHLIQINIMKTIKMIANKILVTAILLLPVVALSSLLLVALSEVESIFSMATLKRYFVCINEI